METVVHLVSQYGHIAIFCLLVLGIVGLPVPDETLLTFAGYLVSRGHFAYLSTVAVAFAGSACGITISYIIGRTGGLFVIHKYGPYVHLTAERLARVHRWFERMGRWALFVGYFMPGIRHFTAIVAGTSELDLRTFARFAYTGALVWVVSFISLGYFLGEQWSRIEREVNGVVVGITVAVLAAALIWWWLRQKKQAE